MQQKNNLSQFFIVNIGHSFNIYDLHYCVLLLPTNRDLSKIDATTACENTTNKKE